MNATKILWGQVCSVFAIALLAIWAATQWTAHALAYQPELGRPWFRLGQLPIYPPPAFFWWWFSFDAYAPSIFVKGAAIAASGGIIAAIVAIGLSIWSAREAKKTETFGSARWAEPREIARAGLLGSDGVVLGCHDSQYLRHDGPEHVLCFAPTRSGKGVGLVIPSLLTWPGSVIVHDIKGENWGLAVHAARPGRTYRQSEPGRATYRHRRMHDRRSPTHGRVRTLVAPPRRHRRRCRMKQSTSCPWTAQLLDQGYSIIPDALPAGTIAALDADLDPIFEKTPFGHGRFYGYRTKRFGSLLKRSRHAEALVMAPTTLAMVEQVLGQACDRIQLNVAQAIEIHPGEVRQFPHRDHDMWGGAKGDHEYLVNVMWPLTPFTADNGATQIYPFSHGADGIAKEDPGIPIVAECPPGSAICFLGSTAHGAGANMTDDPRRAIVIGYSLGWLKPYENLWLAYPPEVARHFSPELAAIAGYAQHRPNLGNYEGQCPSILLGDVVPDHIGAVDALRPDQEAMLGNYAETTDAGR